MGSPNKRSSIIEKMLEKKEASPLGYMADVMMDEEADPHLRFAAAKELAQYVAAKRKSIEITGEDGKAGIPLIQVVWEAANVPAVNGQGQGPIPPSLPPAA